MELPVKLALPTLTHLNVMDLLCPFIPGTVVSVGLLFGHPELLNPINALGAGYKTKLILVILLAYLAGTAIMQVTAFVTHLIHKRIKPLPAINSHTNSYWRRLAVAYVGPELSPKSDLLQEDVDRYRQIYIAGGLLSPDTFESIDELREKTASYEKILQKALANIESSKNAGKKLDSETESTFYKSAEIIRSQVDKQNSVIQKYDANMRNISGEQEWAALYHALGSLGVVDKPFAAMGLLVLSLKSAALGAIWTMFHNGKSWGVGGTLFCMSVLIASSYQDWLIYVLNTNSQFLGTPAIADLIKKLKEARSPAVLSATPLGDGMSE